MDLVKIQKEVIELSLKCGEFIRQEAASFDYSKVEIKGKNDLVSYVDKEVERRMVAALREIVPSAGFVTEEGTVEEDDRELKWVIDPLDGTTNFIHGLPIYSTSIALCQGKNVMVGVVYEVNRDECFAAAKGHGAYCNGKEIKVSTLQTMDTSLLATGFPYYNFERLEQYLAILNELMKNTHGLRRMGSAAVDLAYVAMGRFEGYFEYNLNPWDVAAGALIVQEAGGVVTDFSGGDNHVFGREIIAANGIHQELKDLIVKFW